MAFDFTKLKALREETGVSYELCKKALEETSGDIEKAKKKLLEWGAAAAEKKSTRRVSQGGIYHYTHHNKKIAALVELKCETDFVAANENFQHLGAEIAMQVASTMPESVKELQSTEYIRDPKKKISDLVKEAILQLGENIEIARIVRWELGEK